MPGYYWQVLVIILVSSEACRAAFTKCYYAEKRSSAELPSDAKVITCEYGYGCKKGVELEEYAFGKRKVSYWWGCATHNHTDEKTEVAVSECGKPLFNYVNVSSSHCSMKTECTCCGDLCNAALQCSTAECPKLRELPKTSEPINCYADRNSRSVLSAKTKIAKSPEGQCVTSKKVFISNGKVTETHSRDAVVAPAHSCGETEVYALEKPGHCEYSLSQSCCSDKCNGDTIGWDDSLLPLQTSNSLCYENAKSERCRNPTGNDCSFYVECLGRVYDPPCTTGHNWASTGFKFCEMYMDLFGARPPKGVEKFLSSVRKCLQQSLVPYLDGHAKCDALYKSAVRSHAKCFKDAGFCDLAVRQKCRIMGVGLSAVFDDPLDWTLVMAQLSADCPVDIITSGLCSLLVG